MSTVRDWTAYGYILASDYRKRVVMSIGEEPKTPKKIADSSKLRLNHVSSVLSDLQKKRVVKCLTPKLTRGKIFALTEEGKRIASQLRKME